MRLLVINPNTSPEVSTVIDALVKEETGGDVAVQTVTAQFGFHYLASRSAVAIAGHAVLATAAEALANGPAPDAILLACFGDPALEALQEMTGVPAIGFAEAGLKAAAAQDGPFLVATRGEVWCEMLRDLVRKLDLGSHVCGIHAIAEDVTDTAVIAAELATQAKAAGAKRVVVGGAGLIPSLPAISSLCPFPVLDPHRAAIQKALRLARQSRTAIGSRRPEKTKGLSDPLYRVFSR